MMDKIHRLFPKDSRRIKTTSEIKQYIVAMEIGCVGIATIGVVDQYDKGWYDALRWVIGEYP